MLMSRVNLIPHSRRQQAARRLRLRLWMWVASTYAIVLLVAYGMSVAALSADNDQVTTALEKSTRQIDELSHAATSLRPQLAETQVRIAVARTVGDQPDWSILLAAVSSVVDDEIVLTSLKMEPSVAVAVPTSKPTQNDKPKPAPPTYLTLTLSGMARSQASTTQFALRLERLGLFDRVDLVNSGRQSTGAGEANVFRVDCQLRRDGASPVTSPAAAPNATPVGGKR